MPVLLNMIYRAYKIHMLKQADTISPWRATCRTV
jgi:hypothetical protein